MDISENIIVAMIITLPPTLVGLGNIILQIVGQFKHRNHESTSDDTNSQITLLLNGGLEDRIDKAVKRHVGEKLRG